jgi:hypothetical protein
VSPHVAESMGQAVWRPAGPKPRRCSCLLRVVTAVLFARGRSHGAGEPERENCRAGLVTGLSGPGLTCARTCGAEGWHSAWAGSQAGSSCQEDGVAQVLESIVAGRACLAASDGGREGAALIAAGAGLVADRAPLRAARALGGIRLARQPPSQWDDRRVQAAATPRQRTGTHGPDGCSPGPAWLVTVAPRSSAPSRCAVAPVGAVPSYCLLTPVARVRSGAGSSVLRHSQRRRARSRRRRGSRHRVVCASGDGVDVQQRRAGTRPRFARLGGCRLLLVSSTTAPRWLGPQEAGT